MNDPLDPKTKAALEAAKAEHPPAPKQDDSPNADFGTDWIDEMIAEAPEAPEQESLGIAEESPVRARRVLMAAHGWPDRLIEDDGERDGGEWRAAFALAKPVVEAGGILLLHGRRGNGKTTLASDLAREAKFPADRQRTKIARADGSIGIGQASYTPVYRTAMRFFLDLRATYKKHINQTERDVIDALSEPGLLVIDELQERGESAWENRMLTHLIDARYGGKRPTIIACNLTRDELAETLGPSVLDRLAENGRRIEFTWDSFRRIKR